MAYIHIAVPLLMLSWGLSVTDITSWVRAVVFGFDVGGLRVSPARISSLACMAATRAVTPDPVGERSTCASAKTQTLDVGALAPSPPSVRIEP